MPNELELVDRIRTNQGTFGIKAEQAKGAQELIPVSETEELLVSQRTLSFSQQSFNWGKQGVQIPGTVFTTYATTDNPFHNNTSWTGQDLNQYRGGIKDYRVIFDNVSYEVHGFANERMFYTSTQTTITPTAYDEQGVIGSNALLGMNENDSCPFAIVYGRWGNDSTDAKTVKVLSKTSGNHTITIYRINKTIKKIDQNFFNINDMNKKVIDYYNQEENGGISFVGHNAIASGLNSTALGKMSIATGEAAISLGDRTLASGSRSCAEGIATVASGNSGSHAEGNQTTASGVTSHAEGQKTIALGSMAHAEGNYTIATGRASHAQGNYNVEDTSTTTTHPSEDVRFKKYADIVGNGTDESTRSNAYALEWDGTAHYAGDVYVNCNNDSTGGEKLVTENGTVKTAEQLGSTHNTLVSDSFIYRSTAGNVDVRDDTDEDAEIKAIYGKTVVWNQLIRNGDMSTVSTFVPDHGTIAIDNGVMTYTLTDVQNSTYGNTVFDSAIGYNGGIDASHKYFVSFDIYSSHTSSGKANVYFAEKYHYFALTANQWKNIAMVVDGNPSTVNTRSRIQFGCYESDGFQVGDEIRLKNYRFHDLTLMFGTGNEPTADEFRTMFPEPYYPYDIGSLLSFSATGLKTVGFNQYSGEAEIGLNHNAQGVWSYGANTNLGMTEKIRVIPGETYKFTVSSPMTNTYVYSCYYDVDGNLISARNSVSMSRTVTIPSGVYFIRSYFYNSAGFDEGLNICINLSHSGYRDGEYETYHTETLPLPISTYFPTGMKSAGTVRDELRKDKAVQRVGVVDLGTLNWGFEFAYFFVYKSRIDNCGISVTQNFICTKYPVHRSASFEGHMFDGSHVGTSWTTRLVVKDSNYTDVESFKAALSGVMLYYELAEPVETPINPPLDFTYRAEDFGTEEVLLPEGTEPTSTPMYADISYVQNLRDKLDHLPFNPSVPGDYLVHFDGVKQTYKSVQGSSELKLYMHTISFNFRSGGDNAVIMGVNITSTRSDEIAYDDFIKFVADEKYASTMVPCMGFVVGSDDEIDLIFDSRIGDNGTWNLTTISTSHYEVPNDSSGVSDYVDSVREIM